MVSQSNDIEVLKINKPSASASNGVDLNDSFENDADFLDAADKSAQLNGNGNKDLYYKGTGPRYGLNLFFEYASFNIVFLDMHGKFKTYLKDDGDDFMDSGECAFFVYYEYHFDLQKRFLEYIDTKNCIEL